MSGLDVAVVHHLPGSGGAARVLQEWAARHDGRLTVYTGLPLDEPGPPLPGGSAVVRRPLPAPRGPAGRAALIAALPRYGRALAAVVDAGGHDVVLAFPSTLVQAHETLPALRTPSLAYAPEPLRAAVEPLPHWPGERPGLRPRLAAAGLDPYERRRAALAVRHARAATRSVTHSAYSAAELARTCGVTADVVPLGVDAAVFTPAAAPRDRSVLSVGALHPWKGHQDVVAALGRVPQPRRPPLVVVADRGSDAGPLQRAARAAGVRLEVHRALPAADVVAAYRRAGVVVCAQVREPFGLVPLEAMACAAPVVAVAEGGFRETVRDGRTGLLVPRDPARLADAVLRVLDDPVLAARLGAAGRDAVVAGWTWERTCGAYAVLLSEVAAAGPRR